MFGQVFSLYINRNGIQNVANLFWLVLETSLCESFKDSNANSCLFYEKVSKTFFKLENNSIVRRLEMLVRFSQKWAKEKYEDLIKEAIRFVKASRSCKDLLVKVFFYRKPQTMNNAFRGSYRNVWIHGYYLSDFPNGRPSYLHNIITLKISNQVLCDFETNSKGFVKIPIERLQREIVGIFAHEFKHYLDMRKLRGKHQYRHWEVRATKFTEKQVEKWLNNN